MPLCNHDKASVLIIDDEALIRQSIAAYLEDSGFGVQQADDGPSGLEMARSHDPDVILLDLRMPQMDGLEVLAAVTREAPETPVIVITGLSDRREQGAPSRGGSLGPGGAAVRLRLAYVRVPVDAVRLDSSLRRELEPLELDRQHRAVERPALCLCAD